MARTDTGMGTIPLSLPIGIPIGGGTPNSVVIEDGAGLLAETTPLVAGTFLQWDGANFVWSSSTATMAIGNPIVGGTSPAVLHIGAGNVLAQAPNNFGYNVGVNFFVDINTPLAQGHIDVANTNTTLGFGATETIYLVNSITSSATNGTTSSVLFLDGDGTPKSVLSSNDGGNNDATLLLGGFAGTSNLTVTNGTNTVSDIFASSTAIATRSATNGTNTASSIQDGVNGVSQLTSTAGTAQMQVTANAVIGNVLIQADSGVLNNVTLNLDSATPTFQATAGNGTNDLELDMNANTGVLDINATNGLAITTLTLNGTATPAATLMSTDGTNVATAILYGDLPAMSFNVNDGALNSSNISVVGNVSPNITFNSNNASGSADIALDGSSYSVTASATDFTNTTSIILEGDVTPRFVAASTDGTSTTSLTLIPTIQSSSLLSYDGGNNISELQLVGSVTPSVLLISTNGIGSASFSLDGSSYLASLNADDGTDASTVYLSAQEIYLNGGQKIKHRSVADAITTVADIDFMVTGTGLTVARVFTLPDASTVGEGKMFVIKNSSTSVADITLTPSAGDTIDGGATLAIAPIDSITVVSNGVTDWYSI